MINELIGNEDDLIIVMMILIVVGLTGIITKRKIPTHGNTVTMTLKITPNHRTITLNASVINLITQIKSFYLIYLINSNYINFIKRFGRQILN